MKFDFESLSTEPLFYMLMHSGAFVCVLGLIFFIVGLLFGYATWGRYKRQTRELLGQVDALKDEIAGLKRKVGDHAVKSGPAIAMATETIHMPKKDGSTSEAVSDITDENITTQDALPLPLIQEPPPPKTPVNVIKAKAPAPVVTPLAGATAADKTSSPTPAGEPVVPPAAQTSPPTDLALIPSAELATAEAAPSSSESPTAARHPSALAAIIATPHVKDEPVSDSEAPADILPELIELPPITPLPAVEIQPELDPQLGLIYKTRPHHVDDLTALKGISQGLAQRLHEFGIYTYAQIAAWNEDQIKEFSARLSFKDRIHREHWVEQAKQLAAAQTTA